MMRSNNNEFFYQIISLLLAIIVVHVTYVAVVRPLADQDMRASKMIEEQGGAFEVPRTLVMVIKDFEQEACFILMLWALSIMAYKARLTLHEKRMLNMQINELAEGSRILPEDANLLLRPLDSLPEDQRYILIPRTLRTALTRFAVTGNVQSATDAVTETCNIENERLDSELSMVRYITWAIPSIGFIGTVRGIGTALGQAHEAVQGNIAGVTSSLGVAFNSTLVALLISMVVMFFMHQLQQLQERLVLDARAYSEHNLLRHLKSGN
ncbi:MAG: biopolymer transport protein ExbB/TolQ [Oceanicoccus sp.]|jgi:biopolymer transport protein ExbB/TolQ